MDSKRRWAHDDSIKRLLLACIEREKDRVAFIQARIALLEAYIEHIEGDRQVQIDAELMYAYCDAKEKLREEPDLQALHDQFGYTRSYFATKTEQISKRGALFKHG